MDELRLACDVNREDVAYFECSDGAVFLHAWVIEYKFKLPKAKALRDWLDRAIAELEGGAG